MWKVGCDDPSAFLAKYGWDSMSNATQVEQPVAEVAKKYTGSKKEEVIIANDTSNRKEMLGFVMMIH
jgi:hypothetical protein